MFKHQPFYRWLSSAVKRGAFVGIVMSLLWGMFALFQTAHAVGLQPSSPHSPTHPSYGKAVCLATKLKVEVVGSNTLTANAEVYNGCLANANVFFDVNATNNCKGAVYGPGNEYLQLKPHEVHKVKFGGSFGCVVCHNGKPVGYPPFTVTVSVSAVGGFVYRGTYYKTDSDPNPNEKTVSLRNNPPTVFPGCN